jgi:hypothetical protein
MLAVSHFAPLLMNISSISISTHGFAKELVADVVLVVAAEGFLFGHFVNGLVHGFNDSGSEGLSDIADAKADYLCIGILGFEGTDPSAYFRKQIAGLQFQVAFIDCCHVFPSVLSRILLWVQTLAGLLVYTAQSEAHSISWAADGQERWRQAHGPFLCSQDFTGSRVMWWSHGGKGRT